MPKIAKTYAEFAAEDRDLIAGGLNPVARERFVAGKLSLEVIEFRGEGVRSMEREIAEKKRQGLPVKEDLEALAFAKKWTAEPIVVIPTDLAA
ncbi:hypothetical protein HOU03_gp098 [Caulobacter phage CcrSC]|uniref:Uncharacterized protein n=1 Tax=Caulobacter phage CcrSC TaxID=2283272 RepID=A0A385EDE5_9CAUD|nr:hypothetical protein HOU03_gp098 [Caulobacter phage CcrSC]AXQ69680.1 hypothetical protein CcrSC_gp098 [Caulobacter phage CcrSC]